VHLSSGNYNGFTARIYTDVGLFTANPEFGADVTELFNMLTGYSQAHGWRKLVVAPLNMRERVVALIDREREHARAGRPARIVVKMNALVEPSVVDALYLASQAGVTIELAIRGICCLRPGLPGISENVRVISIVDKFLEHSRIFYFENSGDPEVFLGSADWMPRNFYRRIEVMFPVEDARLKARLVEEILATVLADSAKARVLRADGSYRRTASATDPAAVRSQMVFQTIARGAARESSDGARQLVPILPPTQIAPEDGDTEAVEGKALTPA
jgi:polyphosphate kinase